MSVQSADIRYLLSGGAANIDPLLSLGGVRSSNSASPSTLFDAVKASEIAAGDVEYRCIYVYNSNATFTLTGAVLWLTSNTPSNLSDIAVGLGSSAVNGTEQSTASESAAPIGVAFISAATKAAGLALGDLAPGASRAVWIRRAISTGSLVNSVVDPFTLRTQGSSL